jgi:hypothetical protein
MHEALGARKAVIGVAKAAFAEGSAVPVLRGDSSRPLFVTAAGMNADGAAESQGRLRGSERGLVAPLDNRMRLAADSSIATKRRSLHGDLMIQSPIRAVAEVVIGRRCRMSLRR